MNGSELLVAQLKAEGVEVVFGIPGIHLMHVLDALHGEPSIRFITTRHEQATTYMADGYSRVTGRPGVAMVVPGPGVYNAASGLATAWACSSPVLLVAGQIELHGLGLGLGLTHEIHDQLDVVRPITKSAERLDERRRSGRRRPPGVRRHDRRTHPPGRDRGGPRSVRGGGRGHDHRAGRPRGPPSPTPS